MMLKQISLAALAATFITGSTAATHAEVSNSDPSPTSSAGLRADYAARHGGDRVFASEFPTTGGYAYGYAPERRRIIRSQRNTTSMNHN
jgi:hypothetical protein